MGHKCTIVVYVQAAFLLLIGVSVVECQREIRHERGGQTDRIKVHLLIAVRVWTNKNV